MPILETPGGLVHAPVTLALLAALAVGTLGASLLDTGDMWALDVQRVVWLGEWWRLLPLHQFAVTTTREMLLAGVLLHSFRVVERLHGSRRHAAFVVVALLVHSALVLAAAVLAAEPLAARSGPFAIVFASLALYWRDVPSTYALRIGGTSSLLPPLTNKLFVYALAVQLVLCASPRTAATSALAGFAAGLVFRAPVFLRVANWSINLPLHRLPATLTSRQFRQPRYRIDPRSTSPRELGSFEGVLQAIVQPLRERQRERREQRTRALRSRNQRNARQVRASAARATTPAALNPLMPPPPPTSYAPTREQVQLFVQMGFPEAAAREALSAARGRPERALEMLLGM
eukprot:TRINITY_DN9063_c0_g1_i1.p1 TRINITY_DN9063_c0_g1~~TRINITY_DN9063_c0_g1_i1.p1  ORF type:complete len:345 (-),score=120.47 TRINITY_DN9063_c0_g1_i1:34-1068(-)